MFSNIIRNTDFKATFSEPEPEIGGDNAEFTITAGYSANPGNHIPLTDRITIIQAPLNSFGSTMARECPTCRLKIMFRIINKSDGIGVPHFNLIYTSDDPSIVGIVGYPTQYGTEYYAYGLRPGKTILRIRNKETGKTCNFLVTVQKAKSLIEFTDTSFAYGSGLSYDLADVYTDIHPWATVQISMGDKIQDGIHYSKRLNKPTVVVSSSNPKVAVPTFDEYNDFHCYDSPVRLAVKSRGTTTITISLQYADRDYTKTELITIT